MKLEKSHGISTRGLWKGEVPPVRRLTPFLSSLSSIAYTVDLVLLSHGDLGHAGLVPYAYSNWNLRAPSYCTLPVQAMARMAVVDQVEALRAEEDVDGGADEKQDTLANDIEPAEEQAVRHNKSKTSKCVATVKEVHEAFDSFTTLRYSQPTHLQGQSVE